MKRGYIALGIIAAICLLSYFATNAVAVRAEKLEQLAKAASSDEKNIQAMEDEWKSSRNFFSFFVSHAHLEPIDYRIDGLDYVSKDERQESCAEVIAYAKEIKELISLSLYNVF